MDDSGGPLDNVVDEARRLIGLTDAAGLRVRLLGGAAYGLHIHRPLPERLRRTYGDLDVAVGARDARELPNLLGRVGYTGDERFNALHGERRFLFRDLGHDRKLDVFIGRFAMCHKLDLEGQIPADGMTLSVADLLLTKLQVVQLNAKDTTDMLVLLRDHDVSAAAPGPEVIELARLADVCASDWGWFTTVRDNLEYLAAGTSMLELDEAAAVKSRLEQLGRALMDAPKSRAWRLRAMIGRRLEWYDLPEEVG